MFYCRQNSLGLQAAHYDESTDSTEFEYVGFWLRVWAGTVDFVLLMLLIIPPVLLIFGASHLTEVIHAAGPSEFLVTWLFPALLFFAVWTARNRTLGKSAISAVVLDERTNAPPSMGQQCGRYLGYFLAVIPFGLGLLWVAFDPKKQGWHDKLAGTIVVRQKKRK